MGRERARLSAMPPVLGSLKPLLVTMPEGKQEQSRFRDRFVPWRAWYKTVEWRRLRWATLVRDAFTCQMCGKIEGDTSRLVADHDQPHRGDRALFFDPNNLKTLCASPCHNKHKQRQEQGRDGGGRSLTPMAPPRRPRPV